MAIRTGFPVHLLMILGTVALLTMATGQEAFGEGFPKGEIRICRRPGFDAATVNTTVAIPLSVPSSYTNTYTGACDATGDHCRNIEVAVTRAGAVGPGWNRCAVLPAVMFEGDGKPLKAGQHLLAQWSVPGFEPEIVVTKTFR